MKAGKITAKLRDAVPVCLMVNGTEVGRYKNIELPDEIKALPIMDFGFSTSVTGKFDFNLYFDEGVLPEVLPGVKAKITRAEKRAAKEVAAAVKGEALEAQDAAVEIISAETPEVTEVEALEAIDTELPAVSDTPAMDTADEPQPEAPATIEPVAEATGKKRGRPEASEVRAKKQSA